MRSEVIGMRMRDEGKVPRPVRIEPEPAARQERVSGLQADLEIDGKGCHAVVFKSLRIRG